MSKSEKPGCLRVILQFFDSSSKDNELKEEALPYRLRDDFLSSAELSFYHVLLQGVSDWAVVCPKISLDDLFYAKSGQRSTNQTYLNKIDRKHVDFLLCHPRTMRPMLGIELDDASHQRTSRQERDRFVEKMFAAAGLPLFRQPVRSTYNARELANALKQQVSAIQGETVKTMPSEPELLRLSVQDEVISLARTETFESSVSMPIVSGSDAPLCPHCGEVMVLRTAQKDGPHKGNKFWGCKDYPRCRGVRAYP